MLKKTVLLAAGILLAGFGLVACETTSSRLSSVGSATCGPIKGDAYVRTGTYNSDISDIITNVSGSENLSGPENALLRQCSERGTINWKNLNDPRVGPNGVGYGKLAVSIDRLFRSPKTEVQLYATVAGRLYGYCGPAEDGFVVEELEKGTQCFNFYEKVKGH